MTDRELLELAAKAAGVEIDENGPFTMQKSLVSVYQNEPYFDDFRHDWDPLDSDGDALRLAVKLRISISREELGRTVAYNHMLNVKVTEYDEDEYAATRRAIVRAAAEIGKTR
jgi:hypothetical protein